MCETYNHQSVICIQVVVLLFTLNFFLLFLHFVHIFMGRTQETQY